MKTQTGGHSRAPIPPYSETKSLVGGEIFSDLSMATEKKSLSGSGGMRIGFRSKKEENDFSLSDVWNNK